jgi:hypothetical protein
MSYSYFSFIMREVLSGLTIDKGILPDGTGPCTDQTSEKKWLDKI